ncbi:MAG: prolyl oligopeptidase family serine peptidase [Gammaproteobacteria bacterium]|nr:prolyl oligopeptidase family serine peptidase [Gammaproteobacteria bacterium]MDH5304646.1 prolyl oligopeptidase family serine peptidase [Gammaproteobacteria bacterium]MDH5322497.1 prolyl oligopeptidase family serine peptidase [Gammaproteobacteria bacterium]
MRNFRVPTVLTILATVLSSPVFAQQTGYSRIDEVMDWGAATTRLIVELGAEVPTGAVDADSFSVHVSRSDRRLAQPLLEEGMRKVVEAYVSDAVGKPAGAGRYATLVMAVGPSLSLGNALNYGRDPVTGRNFNAWTENVYTITQQQPIGGIKGGLVATQMNGQTRVGIDEFEFGATSYKDEEYGVIELTFAHFSAPQDEKKNPLIIWLHGGGEGGTDPTIPLAANRATAFVSDEVQAIFGGAYVLAPQSPTRWMHGPSGQDGGAEKPDALSIYTRATQDLIESFVLQQPDVDSSRIYLAGASNGGWLTVRLVLDHPDYYAAALAVAEPLNLDYVSDEELQGIVDLPLWLVTAATDSTVDPVRFPLPLYTKLRKLGADNIHLSILPRVADMSGKYFDEHGAPHEYNGHWSWVPTYNNHLAYVAGEGGQLYGPVAQQVNEIDGREVVTVMEWLAAQKLE